MSAPVRLVAVDLDGTLLRSDGSLSARTRAALAATRAAGVHIVVATARPPRRMRAIARATGLTGLALCSNGAVVYDLERDVIVEHVTLGQELARALIARLRCAAPEIAFERVERGLQALDARRHHASLHRWAQRSRGRRGENFVLNTRL